MCVHVYVSMCVLEHRTAIFNFLIHQRDTAARPWTKRILGTMDWIIEYNFSPTSFFLSFFLFFFSNLSRTLLLYYFSDVEKNFISFAVRCKFGIRTELRTLCRWIFLSFFFSFFENNNEIVLLEWRKRENATPILRDRKFRRDELAVCISTGSPKDTHYA